MDYYKYLRELYEEKKRLDRIIAHLEALAERRSSSLSIPTDRRRGRKPGMSPEEKARISARMREYWAKRRKPEDEEERTNSASA
jgi:hypothetical protein